MRHWERGGLAALTRRTVQDAECRHAPTPSMDFDLSQTYVGMSLFFLFSVQPPELQA